MDDFLAIVEVSSKDGFLAVIPFDPTSNKGILRIFETYIQDVEGFFGFDPNAATTEKLYELLLAFVPSWEREGSMSSCIYIVPVSKLTSGYSFATAKKSWTPENQEKAKKMLSEGKSRCEILKEFDTTIIVIGDYFWPNF